MKAHMSGFNWSIRASAASVSSTGEISFRAIILAALASVSFFNSSSVMVYASFRFEDCCGRRIREIHISEPFPILNDALEHFCGLGAQLGIGTRFVVHG